LQKIYRLFSWHDYWIIDKPYICPITTTSNERHIHQGRNIKRFREMLGIKQEALALELGEDWTQKKVSQLESKEVVDDALLEQVSKVLKIPTEAFKTLDEATTIQNISCNFSDNAVNNNAHIQNFNPIDKWMQALDENKQLYERLLKAEQEKVALLEKLLNK
jgi:transcriptional regulator with XRE-family HTH domain